jgi:hypothetical protein
MKQARLSLPVLVAVLSSFAGAAPAAEPPADHPLAALSWFVGGTWVAERTAPDGQPFRVETAFQWAEHGKSLKYVIHLTAGGETVTQYEGMYYWHPGTRQLRMIQIDRNGNVTESVIKVDGATIEQENQATRVDGTTAPQKVRIVRDGDDAFSFTAQIKRGEEWVDAVALTYKRQRAADAKR